MKKEVEFEKKHIEWLYVLLVMGALAVGGAMIFVLPQQSYSEAENRYLTKLPHVSAEGILSGEVQRGARSRTEKQPGRSSSTSGMK